MSGFGGIDILRAEQKTFNFIIGWPKEREKREKRGGASVRIRVSRF
jgi:hypothetical protein